MHPSTMYINLIDKKNLQTSVYRMVQVRCTGDQFLICSAVHSLVKVLGIKSGDLVTALAHNRSNISQLQPTSNLYMPSSHLFGCLNIPEEIKELSLTCVLRSRLYIYLLRATALVASPISLQFAPKARSWAPCRWLLQL